MGKVTTMEMPGIMEGMLNTIKEHADVNGIMAESFMKTVYGLFSMKGHSEFTLEDVFFPSAERWAEHADITGIEVGQVFKKDALLKELNYLPVQYGKKMYDDSFEAFLKYLRRRGVHIESAEGRSGYYEVVAFFRDGIPYTEVFCDNVTPAIALAADSIARKTTASKKDDFNYFVAQIPNSFEDGIHCSLKNMADNDVYAHFFTGDLARINRDYFVRGGFEKLANASLIERKDSRFVLVDQNCDHHRDDEKACFANARFASELLDMQRKGNFFKMPKRKWHFIQKMNGCPGLEDVVDYYVERTATVNRAYLFPKLTAEARRQYALEAHKHILGLLEKRLHHHETCTDKKKCAGEKECITYRKYYEMYILLLEQKYPEYAGVASATA